MNRARRSRQVRSGRARSYVRTLARVSAGAPRPGDTAAVLQDAKKTGALAEHRRLEKKRLREHG